MSEPRGAPAAMRMKPRPPGPRPAPWHRERQPSDLAIERQWDRVMASGLPPHASVWEAKRQLRESRMRVYSELVYLAIPEGEPPAPYWHLEISTYSHTARPQRDAKVGMVRLEFGMMDAQEEPTARGPLHFWQAAELRERARRPCACVCWRDRVPGPCESCASLTPPPPPIAPRASALTAEQAAQITERATGIPGKAALEWTRETLDLEIEPPLFPELKRLQREIEALRKILTRRAFDALAVDGRISP